MQTGDCSRSLYTCRLDAGHAGMDCHFVKAHNWRDIEVTRWIVKWPAMCFWWLLLFLGSRFCFEGVFNTRTRRVSDFVWWTHFGHQGRKIDPTVSTVEMKPLDLNTLEDFLRTGLAVRFAREIVVVDGDSLQGFEQK